MTKKYLIKPGYVRSKNDGQMHFITALRLMNLYQVKREDCEIYHRNGYYSKELIVLKPRFDGNYNLYNFIQQT